MKTVCLMGVILIAVIFHATVAAQGRSEITDPEVFELANIAYALTEFSQTDPNMTEKRGDYYNEVIAHFEPFRTHELILKLNESVKKNYLSYVANRGYAINFAFDGDRLVETGLYPVDRKAQLIFFGDAFAEKGLWEDLAKKSGFRKFFADNKGFYQKRLDQASKRLPINKIQTWLEREFPDRYDRYTIVVSPLINATHSTFNSKKECFMFVSDASNYDEKKYTPRQIEGLYSGIVFTEIDHNYNNPVSQKYFKEITAAMPDLARWSNGAESKGNGYKTALKIFDEYATHSLYLLYVNEKFVAKDYEILKDRRIDLMLNRRGFSRFREFNEEFLRLYKAKKPQEKIADLYPQMIEWMAKQ